MHTKEQIISIVKSGLADKIVSKDDFSFIFDLSESHKKKLGIENLANIFYVIGGIIIFIGAIILVSMFWENMNILGKFTFTLGIGLFSYISAILLNNRNSRILSQVLLILSSVLMPLGVFLIMIDMGNRVGSGTIAVVSSIMFGLFFLAHYITKKNVLILLNSIYLSLIYFAVLNLIGVDGSAEFRVAIMILALSFLFYNIFYLSKIQLKDERDRKDKSAVSNIIYLISSGVIFGTVLTFGTISDLLMIPLLFVGFYLGIYVKSRTLLFNSAIFTMVYIVKISSIHFSGITGWPILLILLGVTMIGIGLSTIKLSKKYIN